MNLINECTRSTMLFILVSRAFGFLINMLAAFCAVVIINLVINIDALTVGTENVGKIIIYSLSMSD